jgi:hypothetical protein
MTARGDDKPDEAFASLIHHIIVGFLFDDHFEFGDIEAGPIESRLDQVAEHMSIWFKGRADEAMQSTVKKWPSKGNL